MFHRVSGECSRPTAFVLYARDAENPAKITKPTQAKEKVTIINHKEEKAFEKGEVYNLDELKKLLPLSKDNVLSNKKHFED